VYRGWLERTAYPQGAQSYTYGEVYDAARWTAGGLRMLGIRCGDRVLLALPDSVAFVTTFLAVLRIGAVAVPVNTFFHVGELLAAFRPGDRQCPRARRGRDLLLRVAHVFRLRPW